MSAVPHLQPQDPSSDLDEQFEPFESIDPELEARKKQRRDDALGF